MKIKVSDYIADFLVKAGVTHVFSVTGGGAMHLNDSFGQCAGLTKIYNHHEQASAIAAEGFARIAGRPAAVCVTSGPGGTNALTGVLCAWLDSIPMIVISGQVKFETTVRSTTLPLRQLGDQEYDIVRSAAPMTKYAEMVVDPLTIDMHLRRAYIEATTGRMGPVWLDIPLNVQGAIIETDDLVKAETKKEAKKPNIDKEIAKTVEALGRAERPVLLLGSGVRFSDSRDAAVSLAEKLNIPVVTAWGSHDLIENEHPLYSGRPGTIGDRAGNFAVQNADVLLVLGCRLNIRQVSYNWKAFAEGAFKIVVDIDPAELEKPTISPDLPVNCDVKDFIEKLLLSDIKNIGKKEWLSYCAAMRDTYSIVRAASAASPAGARVNPYFFADRMTRLAAEHEIFACGNGAACVCTFQAAYVKPGQRLFANSGCATMGYDLPAAVGALYANSGKRVVCVAGDGSIMMNLQELATVSGHNMNIIIFVLNNNGYISIRQTQSGFFGRLHGADPESGVAMPDFEKVAHGFGLKYVKISKNGEVEKQLKKIYAGSGPVLCEVVLDPAVGFAPKLSSKRLDDGTMVSPPLQDMFPFLPREEFEKNMSISKK
jgi:acetolactate synthase-1/2/3 large subunit